MYILQNLFDFVHPLENFRTLTINSRLYILVDIFLQIKGDIMTAPLKFPSKAAIISYLEQHPLTNVQYFKNEKIIEAVADVFADADTVRAGFITVGVMFQLSYLNEKLKLPDFTLQTIQGSLEKALKDCAEGNSFSGKKVEKITDKKTSTEKKT